MPSEDLQTAIALARSGDQLGARRLLVQIVRAEPANEVAWLWLAGVLETAAERRQALQTCLRFNPQAGQARRALEALEKQNMPAPSTAPAPSPQPPPPPPLNIEPQPQPPQERFSPGASSPRATPPAPALRPLPAESAPRQGTRRGLMVGMLLLFACFVCMGAVALGSGVLKGPARGTPSDAFLYPQNDPVQFNLAQGELPPIPMKDWGYTWTLTPRARYQVTARIISIHQYSYELFDNRARLAPYDFALGWGRMSDPAVDQWITWSQSERWYHYIWSAQSPYPGLEIALHSSNHHLIPANDNLRQALGLAKQNDIIFMEGLLVDAQTTLFGSEFHAPTSLSREDMGDGACEVLYIQRMILNGIEYK